MKKLTPSQMTDDLAAFIKENHEDVAMPHESLYVDLLDQWRSLSNFKLALADEESKRVYHAYWDAMSQWYEVFNRRRDDLMEPAAMPTVELADFYSGLIADLADHVMGLLPDYPHDQVIRLTDFRVLLKIQMPEFVQLGLRAQGPMDFAMLMDYWKLVNDAFSRQIAEQANI